LRTSVGLVQRFDTNKDGKLDDAERAQARKALGQTPAPKARRGTPPNLQELVKRFDTNKDGKLDDAERAAARKALGHRPQPKPGHGQGAKRGKGPPPNMQDLLQRFDVNKDGTLDDAEKQRARDLMKRAKENLDVNRDGEIGPRERARAREQIRRRGETTPPPRRPAGRGGR